MGLVDVSQSVLNAQYDLFGILEVQFERKHVANPLPLVLVGGSFIEKELWRKSYQQMCAVKRARMVE